MRDEQRRHRADEAAAAEYRARRIAHWDRVAIRAQRWRGLGGAYHRRLERVYGRLVPAGRRVLEIGSGDGRLLASLAPSVGVGIDFSGEMVRGARRSHPHLRFIHADALEVADLTETFDAIVLSDLVNDIWDVQRLLERVGSWSAPHTRVVLNVYSRLWEMPLSVANRLGLARARLAQNWLTTEDTENLLELAGLRMVRRWQEVLLPLPLPLLAPLANRFLVRIWPFSMLALSNFFVARPARPRVTSPPRVSVIVPARNEAGNIPAIFDRTPEMGAETELVFVEGHSLDETSQAIEREMAARPERQARLLHQTGTGKADAVRLGFAAARGDVLMILDADLTVPPEDLERFLAALLSGRGELVNGVRLVYPMEQRAMRFANLVANKIFGKAFSWLIGQPIRDTLCGTKVMWKEDYDRMAVATPKFGDVDPFGDFEILFGAAALELEIVELPIRYRERTYGRTNIRRWRHGWMLLKMCFVAAARIKFV